MKQFDFGQNWSDFSANAATVERVAQARAGFSALMRGIEIGGKSFLDIGFGQGFSLLSARAVGAAAVGCDISPKSCCCRSAFSAWCSQEWIRHRFSRSCGRLIRGSWHFGMRWCRSASPWPRGAGRFWPQGSRWIGVFFGHVLPRSIAGDIAKGVSLALKDSRARSGPAASIVASQLAL